MKFKPLHSVKLENQNSSNKNKSLTSKSQQVEGFTPFWKKEAGYYFYNMLQENSYVKRLLSSYNNT